MMMRVGRYSLIYGGLSGLVVIATILSGILLSDRVRFFGSVWFGYLVMLAALTFIFIGVKRYRDIERGGVIRFGAAFGVGLAIAVVAAIVYVVVWEAYLASTHYAFIDDYIAGILRARRAEGVSGAALAREAAKLDDLRRQYADPLFRVPMTFLEIFPVGFVVALASAAILRNPRVLPFRAVAS